MTTSLPTKARAVIIGGGVIGTSIAYHLSKLDFGEIVLIERKQLTSGTTWHAAGLLTTLRSTETQTRLAKYTQDLYSQLEAETGQATGFRRCGSIQIASSEAWLEEMRRGCATASVFDVCSREITPDEIREMWPLADTSDVLAGFHFPDDGRVNPGDVTQAMARGARTRGVQIFENTTVTGLRKAGHSLTHVETDKGVIEADVVVNCAGMWAREIGLMAGAPVPLQAAEHYYLVTEPLQGMHPDLPILRAPGNCAYFREETGKLLIGLFEPIAAPWGTDGIPKDFCFDELPPDWERMEPYLDVAMRRIPAAYEAGIKLFFCGPESFTPDHNYLMGLAADFDNFYVAAGFNSLGILSGGGAGHVMAHWIKDGHPPLDVWDVNIRRMQPFQNSKSYLAERTVESLGIGYQNHWPGRQWETARGIRKSVLHDRVAAAGACFGESAGWERPNWYDPGVIDPQYDYGYGRTNWFAKSAAEHLAVRSAVGFFEQSSFSKFLVSGADAQAMLNWLSTSDVGKRVGKVIYTHFLNDRAGIEADLTISRLAEDRFLLVTPAFTHTHVRCLLNEAGRTHARCTVTDISTQYAMLNVQGPHSRALLQSISSSDFSNDAFPFATTQNIEIGVFQIVALRTSFTGELGWELYIPVEYAQQVYDLIVEAGEEFQLRHCGYHALGSLRIEKAFRDWAHDIGPDDNQIESGLAFTCDLRKPGGFRGREALLRKTQADDKCRRLVQLLLKDPQPLLYHNEPIFAGDKLAGYTSSAAYGHTLGGAVALGYVNIGTPLTQECLDEQAFRIRIGNALVPARASLSPLYDPTSSRMRG